MVNRAEGYEEMADLYEYSETKLSMANRRSDAFLELRLAYDKRYCGRIVVRKPILGSCKDRNV